MKTSPVMNGLVGGLILGVLAGCATPDQAPPAPPPVAVTTPAVTSLASLEGRWVNPDRGYTNLVLGLTVAADGRVTVDRPHDLRRALAFEAFRDGAIILRARYFSRSDGCVPAGPPPVQRLNCNFVASGQPREGTYVLNRQAPR
jgi:hypothetical protein